MPSSITFVSSMLSCHPATLSCGLVCAAALQVLMLILRFVLSCCVSGVDVYRVLCCVVFHCGRRWLSCVWLCGVALQALMAKEAVLKFNPGARIVAHHGNVKESQFGLPFVRSFDIVLNALDNVDARR